MRPCNHCGHKHTTKCSKIVNGRRCNCVSHSSKWDSGSTGDPGGSRRARQLETARQNAQANRNK